MTDERPRDCGHCRHFIDDPQDLEAEVEGLKILSSAFGSVRADTGWCKRWDRFCTARTTCDAYSPRTAEIL
ncbi:MAG: hypothetical protein HQL35_15925 [Alphaproteobacteria bacterium]|nr:hypothetical protein [Alphaproteobacteria bacterium]